MKKKPEDIERLLEALAKLTNETPDHYGFGNMAEKIGQGFTGKYLYYSLHKALEKGKKGERFNPSLNKLDVLAQFLGYANYGSFIDPSSTPIDPILASLQGAYYCYVRKRSTQGVIFQSPVRIDTTRSSATLTLRGPDHTYSGELVYRNQCLFCLMSTDMGKSFHHVYYIGNASSPTLLMGIFSGISSGNMPIGGRCVLIRQDEDFDSLKAESHSIDQVSGDNTLLSLAQYFYDYDKNNLKVNEAVGYDTDDLTNEL